MKTQIKEPFLTKNIKILLRFSVILELLVVSQFLMRLSTGHISAGSGWPNSSNFTLVNKKPLQLL